MSQAGIRVIVTGATGMVGEGVLHECLQHPGVEAVLSINRKPLGITHPKLTEIVHADFYNILPVENQLSGYDACFFCLGVSSVGRNVLEYYQATYTLTLHVAEVLSRRNPPMTFCYVSGAGTDSTEKGRIRWARVKGKTENDLMKLPFKEVYAFRPGFIKPTRGLQHAHRFYRYINWLFPLGRAFFPGAFCTLKELGLSMIAVVRQGYRQKIIEGKDIIALAARESAALQQQP